MKRTYSQAHNSLQILSKGTFMNMKRLLVLASLIFSIPGFSQDSCTDSTKRFTAGSGFQPSDFAANGATGGLEIGTSIFADPGGSIDTENIVFPKTQPFVADYIGEGAGASHLFGFMFLDVDSSGNGIPNFFLVGNNDDVDGDGIPNITDNDDDGDGIPDSLDRAGYSGSDGYAPPASGSMPASFFRNGVAAAAAGNHANDYWQFVPNGTANYTDAKGNSFSKVFVHPGAYLFIDQRDGNGNANSDGIPDMLQVKRGVNKIPAFTLDKGYETVFADGSTSVPGLLGKWGDQWTGSTIFYIADDDSGQSQHSTYTNYSPYRNGGSLLYWDKYSSTNSQPDYDLYGTTNPGSNLIPDTVKGQDKEGVDFWRYRWYESDISGGRELLFFMVVFYGSGGQSINVYYSKASLNPDSVGSPNRNGSGADEDGDNFGVRVPSDAKGPLTPNNWWPRFQNSYDHDRVAACAFGAGVEWSDIATEPTDGSAPVAHDSKNQVWVDKYGNWDPKRRIIAYRALGTWLNTAGPAEARVYGRYGIDLDGEPESAIIRAIDGRMNHLMVGAPTADENAWLLGWEDLYGGGDRDYEDIVWYVTREASGSVETNNIASDLSIYDDVAITSVSFEFTDNFTDNKFFTGTPRDTYINYFYKLSADSEWIPLMGGGVDRDPDLFKDDGKITVAGGKVTREITIQVPASNQGDKELYWKVEMSTGDPGFKPEMLDAVTSYTALSHDFYYETATLPSSNVDYYGSYESPSIHWADRAANRGHFYAFKVFEHGNPPSRVVTVLGDNPETSPTYGPLPSPWVWDAGLTLYNQVDADKSNRTIYALVEDGGSLVRKDFTLDKPLETVLQEALELDEGEGSTVIDGLLPNNFHDPSVTPLQLPEASSWLSGWVHGYNGALLAGTTVLPGSKKEWILGGVKRSSAVLVRAPGQPYWLSGDGMEDSSSAGNSLHTSYVEWALDEKQANMDSMIIFGSESGMIHAVDAGKWRSGPRNEDDVPFDGHFEGDDMGTGEEVWGLIPNNLLDDLKYNITGLEPGGARAVVDSTGVLSVIYDPSKSQPWRRVLVYAQGENGGVDDGRTGSYVWAIDITDPKEPQPLWEVTRPNFHNIFNPAAMAWIHKPASNDGGWRVALCSGAGPVAGQSPSMVFLNAQTGAVADEYTFPSAAGETAAANPALLDFNNDGLIDFAYAATSDGWIVGYNPQTGDAITRNIGGARFFVAPNVRKISDTKVRLIFVSGDNPLTVDEDPSERSRIFIMEHEIPDFENNDFGSISTIDSYTLPVNHKVFSRPRLVENRLVVGTTTGDTINLCDFDPSDPGSLFYFEDVGDIHRALIEGDTVISEFGSIKGPITVVGGVVRAHQFRVDSGTEDEFRAPWRAWTGSKGHDYLGSRRTPPRFNTGSIMGITGWDERHLNN